MVEILQWDLCVIGAEAGGPSAAQSVGSGADYHALSDAQRSRHPRCKQLLRAQGIQPVHETHFETPSALRVMPAFSL